MNIKVKKILITPNLTLSLKIPQLLSHFNPMWCHAPKIRSDCPLPFAMISLNFQYFWRTWRYLQISLYVVKRSLIGFYPEANSKWLTWQNFLPLHIYSLADFFNTIKPQRTSQAYEKSRLVVQAYKDREKHSVFTQSPIIQRASQRPLDLQTS